MSLLSLGASSVPGTGNTAGWHLSFHAEERAGRAVFPASAAGLEIGGAGYHAEVEASLPGGLEGGVYRIVVEGVTDADYARLKDPASPLPFARLYLYWVHTTSSVGAFVSGALGIGAPASAEALEGQLVAVLRVASVTRRTGPRRYEVVLTAREWIFDQLATLTVGGGTLERPDADTLVQALLTEGGRLRPGDFQLHPRVPAAAPAPPPAGGTATPAPPVRVDGGRPVLDAVRELAARMEVETGKRGRGMALIRDGRLHLGPRPVPLAGEPKYLDLGKGLLEAQELEPVVTDPYFAAAAPTGEAPAAPPTRRQFRLVMRGRPDVKPGDVVRFDPPPGDDRSTLGGLAGTLGALVGGPFLPQLTGTPGPGTLSLYVAGVEHRLGRTTGFATTVTGVVVDPGDAAAAWDAYTAAPAGAAPPPSRRAPPPPRRRTR